MISQAETPEQYMKALPEDHQEIIEKLRAVILKNIPSGFEETMNNGMIGYVVPHSVYPDGYHTDPTKPLPFINIASQKKHVALYHMGIYSDESLNSWFTSEYKQRVGRKPDMGKSCIRLKNSESIPYELIGELVTKMSAEDWISLYEKQRKN